jgi:hypothetical protein
MAGQPLKKPLKKDLPEMKRKSKKAFLAGIAGLLMSSLLLMACGERTNQPNLNYTNQDPLPDAPVMGSYNMELSINDFSLENLTYRPYLTSYVGQWELKLEENGRFSVNNSNFLFEGLFRFTSDAIIFYGTNWLNSCFFSQEADEAAYKWNFSDKGLALISLEDDCFDRSLLLTAHSWIPSAIVSN